MEGGYARWWEVVVQGRVTWLCLLGGQKGTSDEYCLCFTTCTNSPLWVFCLRVSHSTPICHQRGNFPAVYDLIGREQYLHQAGSNEVLP